MPFKIEELPGSPKRINRPVTKRVPPNISSSPTVYKTQQPNLPRIISMQNDKQMSRTPKKPVIIASQRAPIVSPNDL